MTRIPKGVSAKTFNCEKESTCIKLCLLFWKWYAGVLLQVDCPSSFKSHFSNQRCNGEITQRGSFTSPDACRNGSTKLPLFGLRLRDCASSYTEYSLTVYTHKKKFYFTFTVLEITMERDSFLKHSCKPDTVPYNSFACSWRLTLEKIRGDIN